MDWLIVQWLILVLVTPLVITFVVLLYGFVGCGKLLGVSDPPQPSTQPSKPPKPDKLSAKAAGSQLVKLTWQNTAGPGVQFTVERVEEGTGKTVSFSVPGADPKFDDTVDLVEGTTYFYKVRAAQAGLISDPSDQSAATTFPEAPADVDPRPKDVNRIDLTWTNKSAIAPDVIIQQDSATGVTETKTNKNIAQPRQFTVDEGSEHKFRVFATVKGFQDNVPQADVRSAELPQKRAKPLAFKAALTTAQSPALAGFCVVQRLASTLLKNSGAQVWLTVSPPATGTLTIERVYLSEPAAAGDPWDSAGAPTKVIDIAQGEQLTLAAGDLPKRLGPVSFNLNQANDLLISFDINASAGECLHADGIAGATAYYKDATQQAATADRSPNAADPGGTFGFVPQRHYLITEIEVL